MSFNTKQNNLQCIRKKKNIEMTKKDLNFKSQIYPKKKRWGFFWTWLNLVWRVELTSSKARRRVENSLRASSETISLAIPSQSMFFDALNATSTTFFPAPLIFSAAQINLRVFRLETQCDCPVLDADSPFVVDPGGGGSSGCAMVVYCVWVRREKKKNEGWG